MKKIGVYGSLRQSMYNHDLLQDSKLIDTKTVSIPFKMVSFGMYPALIPDHQGNHDVVFEIYEVNDEVYRDVEILEGYPDYYKKESYEDFEYYYVPDDYKYLVSRLEDEEHIVDWVQYVKN